MFFALLIATLFIASLVSFVTVRAFRRPVERILERIIQDDIATAWNRYITFAGLVVGISGGVRIYALERYIEPGTPESPAPLLDSERWVLEIYRTIIETLQSIAWMYLVVFVVALIAYVMVRRQER